MNAYRAFTDASWWNQPTTGPADSKHSPTKDGAKKNRNYLKLILSDWSMPIYWPVDGDPEYLVSPTQFGPAAVMRIPAGATPMPTSDGAMVTIDIERGETFSLWQAAFGGSSWSCSSLARYDLTTDGLCSTPPNTGHRGIPPPIMAVRLDELDAGVIAHKLEVFWPGTADAYVFPMCGDEPGKGGTIPEGALLRIKPSVDLSKLKLAKDALVIATALQKFGAVIGDNAPTGPTLKCDRATYLSGRLKATSLSTIPWTSYEFAQLGPTQK